MSRTMYALGISLGFEVTVQNGSARVVSEPRVILRGSSESSEGVWVGEGKRCREESAGCSGIGADTVCSYLLF